jgi:hypothetical protein
LHTGRSVERLGAYAVVAAATLYTIWLGRPDVALTPGAPPHTDLGGHLVALKHLIEVSLPSGRLLDWSHQWFAGYPSFYFYFPLPALVIAVFAQFMPLEMAGKLVAVIAPALLPPATYVFVRASGVTRAFAACATVAAVVFLSLTAQSIFGGNVLSSVIGEYSYALGFACAILYLSRVALVIRGERHMIALTLALAATALCHPIPTLFAIAGSCVALARSAARRQVLLSWIAGFGLTAFWALPFLLRSPYMGSLLWNPGRNFFALFPLIMIIMTPWAVASILTLRPHFKDLGILIVLGAIALALYLIPHGLFAPGRGLPLWHFVFCTWTALGIAAGLQSAWLAQHRLHLVLWGSGLVMLIGMAIVQMDLVRKRSAELLSPAASDIAQYEALLAQLAQLPPGRLHWEYRSTERQLLGGRVALARVPATLPGMRTSQGLLVESTFSSTAYYYLLPNIAWDTLKQANWRLPIENDRNDERMRARLKQLGIDYFVTFSSVGTGWARNAPHSFVKLVQDSAWTVWRVRGSALVEPLTARPRIVADVRWDSAVAEWLATVTDTTAWTVLDRNGAAASLNAAKIAARPVAVRSALGDRMVRFTTSAVGIPHIVRVSYFPNWRAYGAAGPFLAVPGFMIVVPTQRDVTLRFERTWVEQVGLAISLITLIGVVVAWLRPLDRRTSPC